MTKPSISLIAFLTLLLLFSANCKSNQGSNPPAGDVKNSPAGKPNKDADDDAGVDKIKISDANGKPLWRIKEKKFGYKLVSLGDGMQKSGGKMKLEGNNLTIQDAGKDLFKLNGKEDQIRMEDNAGKLLFNVSVKGKEMEVQDSQNKLIYRVKPEDKGFKITDDKDQLLGRIKPIDNRVVVESPDGKTKFDVKGIDNAFAVSALGLDKMNDQQRAALMVMLNRKGKAK